MQVVDHSKKYELPKQCGNHAEIFPKNIFCFRSHWVWQNKSDGESAATRTKNGLS